MWLFLVLLIFRITIVFGQSPIIDSRCYLDGGGSAESFLASEDMTVGSVIGKLRVKGNPSENLGDINISLREKGSPVKIAPGTKDIVLIMPLDKEGIAGPSSVYVNVICDRRHSTDPSFVIPVNIRVTDVNDNAPEWIGAPYSLHLSEVTVPGTRILQGARAVDKDQQGAFATVEYQVLKGPFSDYVSFVTPLEGTLVLRKSLDYEALKNFTVMLRAQDQGTPPKFSDTTLRVVVEDADDQNPKFLRDSYRAELLPDGKTGELKILPEPMKAVDQDEGLKAPVQYTLMQSVESKHFAINSRTGAINLVTPLPSAEMMHGITLVIKATQLNNVDRYALTTLILFRNEGHQTKPINTRLTFLQSKFQTKVPENLSVGSRLLALPTNHPRRHLQYLISDHKAANQFSMGALGEIILQQPLDYEKSAQHRFTVMATDGISNATTEVNIDVMDVNDWEPRFRQGHYEFVVTKGANEPVPLGKLEAADGDKNDGVSIAIRGAHAHYFDVDSEGMLWMKQMPNVTLVHLLATATDTGIPPKSSSVPVTIAMENVTTLQSSWASGILGVFGAVIALFILVITAMSIYIYKQKKPNGKNRIHSHDSSVSAANLVNHEKAVSGANFLGNSNIRMANPLNNNNNHGGSGSSISAGASTILAASLEREAQREREREKDNYTATVRSIISRASAARGGQLFDNDMDRDSISNSDIARPVVWNVTQEDNPEDGRGFQRAKKLSWSNGGAGPIVVNGHKTDLMASTDNMGSTENNLTVYF
ncbi:protocadherin beta-12 isoform X2 [Bradysia coprophila]|uniref:protocadherin beta-12 isoform X2 n=1 Tax=Bradysia coprophila TaxID=38358 RepID=UPI00187D927A|nr:protocadherin beta-12 isoform X2 [Bradysia coprophila]